MQQHKFGPFVLSYLFQFITKTRKPSHMLCCEVFLVSQDFVEKDVLILFLSKEKSEMVYTNLFPMTVIAFDFEQLWIESEILISSTSKASQKKKYRLKETRESNNAYINME